MTVDLTNRPATRRFTLAGPDGFIHLLAGRDVHQDLERVETHLRHPNTDAFLLDWRGRTGLRQSTLAEGTLAIMEAAPTCARRWAVLIGPAPVDLGTARMFQLRAAIYGQSVELFIDMKRAVDWLLMPRLSDQLEVAGVARDDESPTTVRADRPTRLD